MNSISFSIVVATKGRVQLLVDLIKSVTVARNNYYGDSEFIIVDDSSEREKKEIIEICKKYDCKYFYYKNVVSAKRNYGVQKAKNDVILFLDSDCIVTDNILSEYAKKYINNSEIAAVAGPLTFVGEDTWFWKAIEATPYLTCFYLPKYVDYLEWGVTANFSVKKVVFNEIGGFDSNFKKPAGEDVDLGLMIREAGYKICGSPESNAFHSKKTWIPFKAMWRRLKYYGAADCDLTMKHPQLANVVLPRRFIMYVLYALIIIILSIIVSLWLLLLIPVVIVMENMVVSFLINETIQGKKVTFSQQMMAQLLIHRNDVSYIFQCVKRGYFKGVRKQMIYYLGQYEGMLNIGIINAFIIYGILFSLLIVVGILI